MTLDGRHREVVSLVAQFKQLRADQVGALAFHGQASRTPYQRTLKQLAERRYLARIVWPRQGGERGGSIHYVYQLGPLGWPHYRDGRYLPARAVNFHSLAIADAYISLLKQHRAGAIVIRGYTAEPDCWVTIGRHELKPDLFADVQLAGSPEPRLLWLEVDLGTEGQSQIKAKMWRYWNAYNEASGDEWPRFPAVVFVAVDEYRSRELKWLKEKGPKEAQGLFSVMTLEELGRVFVR